MLVDSNPAFNLTGCIFHQMFCYLQPWMDSTSLQSGRCMSLLFYYFVWATQPLSLTFHCTEATTAAISRKLGAHCNWLSICFKDHHLSKQDSRRKEQPQTARRFLMLPLSSLVSLCCWNLEVERLFTLYKLGFFTCSIFHLKHLDVRSVTAALTQAAQMWEKKNHPVQLNEQGSNAATVGCFVPSNGIDPVWTHRDVTHWFVTMLKPWVWH